MPFVGRETAESDVYYALGYGGNGITFGVAAAAMLSDELTGVPNADAPLLAFTRGDATWAGGNAACGG